MKKYVFMTEEASMEKFLEVALPVLVPQNTDYQIIPHEGKQDLEKSIPRKLRAWTNYEGMQYHFIIIRDKDSGDCVEVKNKIAKICKEAGRKDTVVIIAVHELESWFLGDLVAVQKAYNLNNLANRQRTKLFRLPDKIANASEQLYKLCNDSTKISRAKKIAAQMNFEVNNSASFNHFKRKIQQLVNLG